MVQVEMNNMYINVGANNGGEKFEQKTPQLPVSNCFSSHVLPNSRGNVNEFTCNKCSVYESRLKEALDELGSARTIIDILQKTLLASTTNTQDNNPASTKDS